MVKPTSPDTNSEGNGGYDGFCRPLAHMHKFYISGELGPPEQYRAWFEEIRSAPEADVIYLHINSPGGDVFTAIQFLRVLYETKATTVASVEGLCVSAATMIFLGAQNHEITNHSMFMFHNFSTYTEGKGGEVYDHAFNSQVWGESLFNDIYGGFLTKLEMESILVGKNLYMTGEEVHNRLKLRKTKLKQLQKKMIRESTLEENQKLSLKKTVKSKIKGY